MLLGASLMALLAGGVFTIGNGIYGLTLFVVLPVAIGAVAVRALGASSAWRAQCTGAIALVIAGAALLLLGVEGAICLVMALPLTMALGALGGWMAYRSRQTERTPRDYMMLLLLPSSTLAWDVTAAAPVYDVQTSIEIAAAPEAVWKHVVSLSEMPDPGEWFFHAGLAYPRRVRTEGSGPDATRYCEFSTGTFLEPIEIWDEPRLLRFRITESPAPMRELSPWGDIQPKHLHGYFVSERGQFRLTALPGGRTRLQGTSWYRHGLWPAQYWRWWSDAIIHRIHLRVLNHIRVLAEA
jgi:hypothetical protein